MIALGIRYLTKYAVATDLARQRPEWPPHPGRVFMAMAAAHFESGADPQERAALEWLEGLDAPAMRATEAYERSLVRAYVPVNDTHGGIVSRPRQDRVFPRVRPHEDTVALIWNAEPTQAVREALRSVCGKVTRIGHSSSAVQMWVIPQAAFPEPNRLPASHGGQYRLRVATRGTMKYLEGSFNGVAIQQYDAIIEALAAAKGKEKTRLKKELDTQFGGGRPESRRPVLSHWQGYCEPAGSACEAVVSGPFESSFIVLAKDEGPALGLETTFGLTTALRNAAMKACGVPPPEWLSGHDENEAPSQAPHVAFFPLPYVGSQHGDGHLLGLGIAIPRCLPGIEDDARDAELKRVLGPLLFDADKGEGRPITLWSKAWRWELTRENRERPPLALRRDTWTQPNRKWASVTPVVLHHHPKKNREGDVERIVTEAFVTAGFPAPVAVETGSVSVFSGAGHAMSVPPFEEGAPGLCRYQIHVVAHFRELVEGPMLVGRGRYRGYGLFRPLTGGGQA